MIGGKAPIMQGALLSSVLVPFVAADELLDTVKELLRRIWDFWDEYGNNRERVGELIQRVGLPAFLDGIGLDPIPEMVSAPRDNPTFLSGCKGRCEMSATTEPRITDIGPPHYEKYLHPLIRKTTAVEVPRKSGPRVYCHVAESGDRIYTVRAGTPRLLSVQTLRIFADLADNTRAAISASPAGTISNFYWTIRCGSSR